MLKNTILCWVVCCLSCGGATAPSVPASGAAAASPEKEDDRPDTSESVRPSKCTWYHTTYRTELRLTPDSPFPIPEAHQAIIPAAWHEDGIEISKEDVEAVNLQLTAELAAAYHSDPRSMLLMRSYEGSADCILDYIEYYYAQYHGWTYKGRRQLMVQFFLIMPESLWDADYIAERLEGWREVPKFGKGGGAAHWKVWYDLDLGRIETISIDSGR